MRPKSHDGNNWPPPVKGLDFDLEGPSADHLIDVSHIYDKPEYQHVRPLKEEWTLMKEDQVESYLPIRKEALNITVGIAEKKTVELATSKAIRLDDHFEHKRGYIINTGASIWGLDFVPKLNDADNTIQYLAISGYRGSVEEHMSINTLQPPGSYRNAIQIWKLKLSVEKSSEQPLLDMCLLFDFGVVYDLKWCPNGAYEENSNEDELYKLGILSFACGDGTIRTIVVPHPEAVRKYMCPENTDPTKTVYLRIDQTRCTFYVNTAYALQISWGGHKKLAGAYTSGSVSVWNMESALKDKESQHPANSRRHLMLSTILLDAPARGIAWNGLDEPRFFAVVGLDGQAKLVDSDDPFVHMNYTRIRGIFGACGWSGHGPIVIYVDADNVNRGISFNSDGSTTVIKYGDCPGFCWSIATSEHHGHFALGTSIGWVKASNMYQVKTRNLLISQNTIYKLHYNEDTQVYRYIDGIGLMTFEQSKKIPSHRQYGDTHMAIQRVVWNPNKQKSAFIASGGAAGLCRIEFEGRGSKWT